MSELSLLSFSNQLADLVARMSPSVVQVQGRRRPASGIVFRESLVVTTTRALGQEDGLRVRSDDGTAYDAELGGWDPATSLVLLRVPGLAAAAAILSETTARVGHLALAVGRSWSNSLTATAGIVAVIGGPLPTGGGRSIDRVIRTTAPMHGGFAGGALVDAMGQLIGVATAAEIRGLAVVIPSDIVWKTAAALAEHGTLRRGFLGVAGQAVRLPTRQRDIDGRTSGFLIVGVSQDSPADGGGILVGDVMITFDGQPVTSPVDLLELLQGDRVGRDVTVTVLRGTEIKELAVTVDPRPNKLMRIVIVGMPKDRQRLREALRGSALQIVDEAPSVSDARRRGVHADALLVANANGVAEEIDPSKQVEPLTPREIEVLERLADGLPNKEIASRLGISDQTVKFHVASICGKLGALNRTEAVRLALRRGLIAI